MKIKEEIIAIFKYEANVEIISDDDKAKAIDLVEIINSITETLNQAGDVTIEDIINKAYSKEYDEPIEKINPGQPNFEVPEGGYDGSEVTIKFYHTMGAYQREILNYYIEEFNKIYPNIHIVHEQVGGYNDVRNQISTEIMVNNEPNLAFCREEDVALYNLSGVVAHLDKLIDSEESDGNGGILGLTSSQKDEFIYGFLDAGRRFGDGLLYTLPISKSTDILYFNKDFFEENNLTVPDHWFSFDNTDTTSVEYVIEKIKEIDPDCFPLAIDSEQNLLFNLCSQMGTGYLSTDPNDHYSLNNPYTKAVMKILNDWYKKGYIITQSLYGSYVSSLFTNTDSSRPRSYMAIASSASATHMRPYKDENGYPFEVGTSIYPQISYLYTRATYQGPSLCIFKKDNPQEVIASWLFAKFLATDVNFQSEYSMASGYMPVISSATYTEVYRQFFWNLADGYDYIMARAMQTAIIDQFMYVTPVAYAGIGDDISKIKNMFINVICYKNNDIDDYIELRFNQLNN